LKAEIITIGDEILIGQILDSNSKWISEELNKIGIEVYQITSIHDDETQIKEALKTAEEHCDIIIITGGLGPTNDDITKNTLTDYYNDYLIFNKPTADFIEALFAKLNYPFTEINRLQAMVPSKCIPLENHLGTAPGLWFNNSSKIIVSLPGVPNEMKGLMKEKVLPRLQEKFKLPFIIHKTILTYGMGESMVAEKIASWEKNLPKGIKLAYLPAYGKLRLRLSAKGFDKEKIKEEIDNEIIKLQTIIGDIIQGIEEADSIEKIIGDLLKEKNQTIATAESCTGGNIAHMITSIPGSSKYFVGSVVSYASRIKTDFLKISPELIKKYTVVSKEVAEKMAVNIKGLYHTDFAISTTGNAGPTIDKTDETLGVVYISIATPTTTITEKFNFGQPREKVIKRASLKGLEMLKKEILKNN